MVGAAAGAAAQMDRGSRIDECGILAGTASDPNVLRLLPPFILEEQHVDMLVDALRALPA